MVAKRTYDDVWFLVAETFRELERSGAHDRSSRLRRGHHSHRTVRGEQNLESRDPRLRGATDMSHLDIFTRMIVDFGGVCFGVAAIIDLARFYLL
jgi:hypothetical protein